MRYLVLTDLHANLHALDAVLADARSIGYDQVLVLGDLVGCGGDPGPVIDRTLELKPVALIRGNHDKVAAGLEPATLFNEVARRSIEWTASVLTPAQVKTLVDLPKGPMRVTNDLEICHGTPFDEDHYVFDGEDAAQAMDAASGRICLSSATRICPPSTRRRTIRRRPAPTSPTMSCCCRRAAPRSSTSGRSVSRATATRAPPTGCSIATGTRSGCAG